MKKLISILLAISMLLILCACGNKSEVIGAWKTTCSVIGYDTQTDEPYEISINFGYNNEAQESHYLPDSNRNVSFYFTNEGDTLTVWQSTNVIDYKFSVFKQGDKEFMELTAPDGTSIVLERVSDRPLGVQ